MDRVVRPVGCKIRLIPPLPWVKESRRAARAKSLTTEAMASASWSPQKTKWGPSLPTQFLRAFETSKNGSILVNGVTFCKWKPVPTFTPPAKFGDVHYISQTLVPTLPLRGENAPTHGCPSTSTLAAWILNTAPGSHVKCH